MLGCARQGMKIYWGRFTIGDRINEINLGGSLG